MPGHNCKHTITVTATSGPPGWSVWVCVCIYYILSPSRGALVFRALTPLCNYVLSLFSRVLSSHCWNISPPNQDLCQSCQLFCPRQLKQCLQKSRHSGIFMQLINTHRFSHVWDKFHMDKMPSRQSTSLSLQSERGKSWDSGWWQVTHSGLASSWLTLRHTLGFPGNPSSFLWLCSDIPSSAYFPFCLPVLEMLHFKKHDFWMLSKNSANFPSLMSQGSTWASASSLSGASWWLGAQVRQGN